MQESIEQKLDIWNYIQHNYGTNVMVIFDGYPTDPVRQENKTADK